MKKYTWYFEHGFEIELTKEQVLTASHHGECYPDVKAVAGELNLNLDPDTVRKKLKEYGAWNEQELSDDTENLYRVIWIAAGNIREEYKLRS